MKTLRECVQEAGEKKVAIGHFNISNTEGLWGVFRAAQGLGVPVIIGVSEGERDFIGVRQAVALVKSLRDEYDYPIFINADHTYSFEKVKETVDAGFDSVIFDGAKLSFEENVKITKQCVEYARSVNPEIIVEGELGFIGTSSKVFDKIPEGVSLDEKSLTDPVKAKEFVTETGVDMLAPAVGNFHGMLRGGVDPRLNIDRIKEISELSVFHLYYMVARAIVKRILKKLSQMVSQSFISIPKFVLPTNKVFKLACPKTRTKLHHINSSVQQSKQFLMWQKRN